MAMIAVASVKGAPGVTTACLGMAAAWPQGDGITVIECDPAGADIAARHQIPVSPGVVELAAAFHGQPDDAHISVASFTRQVQVGNAVVPVIPGPVNGREASAAVAVLTAAQPDAFAASEHCLLADVGRIDPGGVAWPLLELAAATVVVVDGCTEQIAHLRAMLPALYRACGPGLCVAVVPATFNAVIVNEFMATLDIKVSVVGEVPVQGRAKGGWGAAAAGRARKAEAKAWRRLSEAVAARVEQHRTAKIAIGGPQ